MSALVASADQLAVAGFAGLGIGVGMVLGLWAIRMLRKMVDSDGQGKGGE